MLKVLVCCVIVVYLCYADKNKVFPFKKKEPEKINVPEKTIDDYSLLELRMAYYKKLKDQTQLNPALVKHEQDFSDLIKKTDVLVRVEYPQSIWTFHQKNVGASVVLNTKVDINIFTYDGRVEKRTVLIKNGAAYALEPLINTATPQGCEDPYEVFSERDSIKPQKKEEKEVIHREQKEKELSPSAYVTKWFDDNYDYLQESINDEIQAGNSSILIPKDMYEDSAAHLICETLVDKWGLEGSSVTEEGIRAYMYMTN